MRPWPRFAVRWFAMRTADPCLLPFVRAAEGAAADVELGRLLSEVADPIIRGIVARKFRVRLEPRHARARDENTLDAEDTCSEVHGLLARRLHSYRRDAGGDAPIADFRGYVAGVAYSAWVDYLRRRWPERARLLNQLRYLLEDNRRHSGFALWIGADGERLCGFAAWRHDGTGPAEAARLAALLADPVDFVTDALPYRTLREVNPARLLAVVFDRLGGPARLEDVLDAMARLWETPGEDPASRLHDAPMAGADHADLACALPGPHEQARWAEYLRWLWDAVGGLNVQQRAAFLLNSEVVREFEHAGVASIRTVAGALDVSPTEFAAFWDELPLSDAAIAARLGTTRQQVINLRKAARIILGRRLSVLLADPPTAASKS